MIPGVLLDSPLGFADVSPFIGAGLKRLYKLRGLVFVGFGISPNSPVLILIPGADIYFWRLGRLPGDWRLFSCGKRPGLDSGINHPGLPGWFR